MTPPSDIREWNWGQDSNFLCSTNTDYLQKDVINTAFSSDALWWANGLPEPYMTIMVDNCLCFGVYKLESTVGETEPRRTMVGFARVITDYVTFGYLTDVFVVKEYQGKGLGRWLMACLNEVLESWPQLRRFMLVASAAHTIKLYDETLGMKDWHESFSSDLFLLQKAGPAARRKNTVSQ